MFLEHAPYLTVSLLSSKFKSSHSEKNFESCYTASPRIHVEQHYRNFSASRVPVMVRERYKYCNTPMSIDEISILCGYLS